jgi:hypothetical protein
MRIKQSFVDRMGGHLAYRPDGSKASLCEEDGGVRHVYWSAQPVVDWLLLYAESADLRIKSYVLIAITYWN